MDSNTEIRRFKSFEEMSRGAAELVLESAIEAVNMRNRFSLVLSGGRTPWQLYRILTEPRYIAALPWDKTHLFWGDERCVPSDHPESNFAMAYETFISKVPVPPQNVHRMPVEFSPVSAAAKSYEKTIKSFFAGRRPSFDLVLLGMGKDGHTASLFPSTSILDERDKWVAEVFSPNAFPPVKRISLTLPAINLAQCAAFLISDPDKTKVAEEILRDPESSASKYPTARVKPRVKAVWFIHEH